MFEFSICAEFSNLEVLSTIFAAFVITWGCAAWFNKGNNDVN